MSDFAKQGFEICRNLLPLKQIQELRREVDHLLQASEKSCLRNLRRDSATVNELSNSSLLRSLLPDEQLSPVRSILFDKTPERNWPVLWHQDLTIAIKEEKPVDGYGPWSVKENHPHVQPPLALLSSMVTIRLHLDDTPASNGALSVIPKSHLRGRIPSETIDDELKQQAVTCECDAGDALLMSPLILHSSARSKEPNRRRVIHIEYARRQDLDSQLQWLEI